MKCIFIIIMFLIGFFISTNFVYSMSGKGEGISKEKRKKTQKLEGTDDKKNKLKKKRVETDSLPLNEVAITDVSRLFFNSHLLEQGSVFTELIPAAAETPLTFIEEKKIDFSNEDIFEDHSSKQEEVVPEFIPAAAETPLTFIEEKNTDFSPEDLLEEIDEKSGELCNERKKHFDFLKFFIDKEPPFHHAQSFPLGLLPDNVLAIIIQYLPLRTALNLTQTDKRFFKLRESLYAITVNNNFDMTRRMKLAEIKKIRFLKVNFIKEKETLKSVNDFFRVILSSFRSKQDLNLNESSAFSNPKELFFENHKPMNGMVAAYLKEIGQNPSAGIESLVFKKCKFPNMDFKNLITVLMDLPGYQKLSKLTFNKCELVAKHFEELEMVFESGAFKNLKELELTSNSISNAGAIHLMCGFLRKKHSICSLVLNNNNLDKYNIELLSDLISEGGLPQLTSLNLSGNKLSRAHMFALRKAFASRALENLEILNLSDCNFEFDIGLGDLFRGIKEGHCKKLKIINLACNSISDLYLSEALKDFNAEFFQNLNELILADDKSNHVGFKTFESLANVLCSARFQMLGVLNLNNNKLENSALSHFFKAIKLGNIPNLREFHLSGNIFGDFSLFDLAELVRTGKFPFLEKLDLSNNNLNSHFFCDFVLGINPQVMPNFTELILNKALVLEQGKKGLIQAIQSGNFSSVRHLDLSLLKFDKKLSGILVQCISAGKLPNLEKIDLKGSRVGDKEILILHECIVLGELKSLKKVSLFRTDVSLDNVSLIIESLKKNQ